MPAGFPRIALTGKFSIASVKLRIAAPASAGTASGRVMVRNSRPRLAPWTAAASSKSAFIIENELYVSMNVYGA